MKKTHLGIALATLALFCTGCWQKSVHTFYQDNQVLFEDKLLGTWQEPKEDDHSQSWRFQRGRGDSYELVVQDDDTRLEFDARLFTLGESRFLDLYSRKRSVSEIPAHHLFRVVSVDSSLEIQILSGSWIKDWVNAHPKDIAHVRAPDPDEPDNLDKGEFVLTADTKTLQQFVLAHLHDEGFFDKTGELRKLEQP